MPAEVPSGVTPTYAQQYRRCGKPSCPLCAAGGRGHGPYWYAYWREGGRTRSRYLGKVPPPGAPPREELAPPEVAGAPPAGAGRASIAAPADPAAAPSRPHSPRQAGSAVVHGGEQATSSTAGAGVRPASTSYAQRSSAGPGLRARTLGSFALWRGEERLASERWERRREGALLKWLLAAPGHRLTRDEAAERFWPEAEPRRSMANLRVLVHRLRRELGDAAGGEGILRYDGQVLALAPGGAGWLDTDAFVHAARAALVGEDAGACRAALARYAGDFLPGDAYEEWALGRREELRGQRLAVLLHLAGLCAASGETEEAEGCLRAVLAADPCREEAAVALMRLLVDAGRPGQALRVYRRLAEVLREDLGLVPERETQALARDLAGRLAATAPLPSAEPSTPNNLPVPLSSFIGRRRDLTDLRGQFLPMGAADGADDVAAPCRLLTLTGPGGAGKTRLALRLADDLVDAPGVCPDGAWLVELASLAGAALVPIAVARLLGVREEATRPLAETLADHLKAKRLLLVLDNCEHLLDACADLAATLLAACPHLRVLATSRAPLGVAGERAWPVPPLTLPDPREGSGARLLESEAARLFLDRARAQRPDLALTGEGARAVAQICRRLEGMPLAIELAAARSGVLSLGQIAARLQESFALLAGGPRSAPARQRTLRATLDWSHALLDAPERILLRRLAVFAGGCALEAAEAVCAGEGPAAEEVLDLLGGLARQSLVQVEATGAARYGMLEAVRRYAGERLAASGEQADVERRHAAYYVALAERAEPGLKGAEQAAWLARLDREHDNLRAVLHRTQERGDHLVALRVAAALWMFWNIRGFLSEGREWLEGLLARTAGQAMSDAAAGVRATALNGAGALAHGQGDYARARMLQEESLALRRKLGDKQGTAASLNNLAGKAHHQGDYERARTYYEESLALRHELDDKHGAAGALNNLGNLAYAQGDNARARLYCERSLALCRELGINRGIAYALMSLGAVAYKQGDTARAILLHQESLALFREVGDRPNCALSLYNLADVLCDAGDHSRARALHAEALALFREVSHRWGMIVSLEGLARTAAASATDPELLSCAARLWGACAAARTALGVPLPPNEHATYEGAETALRAGLGEAAWAAARAEGHAMALEEAVALAPGLCRAPAHG